MAEFQQTPNCMNEEGENCLSKKVTDYQYIRMIVLDFTGADIHVCSF